MVSYLWFVTELKLTGCDKDVFSIIYGFNIDGETEFKGSISYIEKWTGASRRTVQRSLNKLVELNYITKREEYINGVVFPRYSINVEGVRKAREKAHCTNDTPHVNLTPPRDKMTPNNIVDNIEDNIEKSIYSDKSSYISFSPVQRQNDAGTATKTQEIFINFPLLGGSYAAIPEEWCDKQQELFGESVNVRAEIKLAMAWCESNHLKKDWKKFLNNWFSNSLAHGGSKIPYVKTESASEIQKRNEDYEKLEARRRDEEEVAAMMARGEI